jgi:DNA-binding transcriptional ArsR family regulator
MDLPSAKCEIMEALLLHDKPVKAAQLAKDIGKEFRAVQMHLIGLAKMGYAESPQKGQYLISAKGKKALGIPEDTKEKALTILAATPLTKAFHFYAGIGKPLNVYAHDLLEFCDKLSKVTADSVEFHLRRGDFEAWFKFIGDLELAKKAAVLKEKKMSGEELRVKLRELSEDRCLALSQIVGQ